VFPYVKYTSVKSYSFNKPDSIYYADTVISIQAAYKNYLENEFIDDEKRWKVFSKAFHIATNGIEIPIVINGKVTDDVIEHSELRLEEIIQFSECFDTTRIYETLENGKSRPMKPASKSECIPTYRDAILFFDGDEIVASVWVCFQCHQIKFQPYLKKKIFCYQLTWTKLKCFFEEFGHEVGYHERLYKE